MASRLPTARAARVALQNPRLDSRRLRWHCALSLDSPASLVIDVSLWKLVRRTLQANLCSVTA